MKGYTVQRLATSHNRPKVSQSLADVMRCLFSITFVLALYPLQSVPYEGQEHLLPMTQQQVASKDPTVSGDQGIEEIALARAEKDPVPDIMEDWLTGLEDFPPMTEERRPSALKNRLLSVHGKKGESLFHQIIIQAADRHQVDPNLVKAIIMAESGYNPRAISKRGARGLMQLMPRTARAMGVEDIFDPRHNIDGGVRYLRKLLNQFDGDVKLAIAAYNAGCGNVRKYQGIPPFKATQFYVRKVFEYYQNYKEHLTAEFDRA